MPLTKTEYNTLHKRNLRRYSKTGVCSKCLVVTTTHWSNISHEYLDIRSDWQELCPKCHREYDNNHRLKVIFNFCVLMLFLRDIRVLPTYSWW